MKTQISRHDISSIGIATLNQHAEYGKKCTNKLKVKISKTEHKRSNSLTTKSRTEIDTHSQHIYVNLKLSDN